VSDQPQADQRQAESRLIKIKEPDFPAPFLSAVLMVP
jgi:hypothetical protein